MMSEIRKQKMIRFFNIYDGNRDGEVSKADFELPVKAGAAFLGYAKGSSQFEEMYRRSMGWWSYIRDQSGRADDDVIVLTGAKKQAISLMRFTLRCSLFT